MFKQLSIIEVKGGDDRIHRYECPPNSPPGEVHDAISAMKAYVLRHMQEEYQKEKEKQDSEKEEVEV